MQYLAVNTIMDISGPDTRQEQQQFECQRVRRHPKQSPAVRDGLWGQAAPHVVLIPLRILV